MGLENKYDSKHFAKLWADTQRMVAVIVGEVTQLTTQPFGKLEGEEREVVAQRYKIRILGQDPPDKPDDMLPVAYPLQLSSGLGAESMGIVRYKPNTYVYVSKDPNSGTYLIERVVPNYLLSLNQDFDRDSKGNEALSGFLPGSTDTVVPETFYLKGKLNSAELFGYNAFSEFDIKTAYSTKLPPFPSPCKPVNTAGVNDAIDNLIKEVESLRTGIIGEDSFLATSGEFIKDAQNTINGASFNVGIGTNSYEISLGNAAGDIGNIVASLIQKVRQFVLRRISSIINNLIGNVPLSARYLANEATDKALSAISCLFYRILKGLEGMIGNILRQIINKVLNSAECLVESLLAGIIGNILGNLIGAINSILSSVGNAIGAVIGFANDLLQFVIDILDFFKCPVKNECPQAEEWDFLNGSTAPKTVLDFNSIFEQAKGVVETVSNSVGNVTATFDEALDDFSFTKDDGSEFDPLGDINVGNIFQSIINGNCNVGAVNCGPPNVVFFGGNGSGGTGNAIINTVGEILGVQIITPGNYESPPIVEFQDACGNGNGGSGTVVIDDNGGITDVIIDNPGYGYEPFPYGDKGGGGRVWADRCQTTVLRGNYDWDIPSSNGKVITVFYGDTVYLPGKDPVVIDANFTEDKIPGCIIRGTNPKLKDMTGFDYSPGFADDQGRGGDQYFGYGVDYVNAKNQGFSDSDIRYFLENRFFQLLGPAMREKLLDPNWGRIPEFSVTFTAPGCPEGTPEDPNQPPTGGIGDSEVISILGGIVISNPGFGYDDGDQLIIDGDNGGSGDLVITNGAITGVRITNPGIGYTSLPDLSINTRTGYNAVLKPVLRFVNPNDDGFVVPFGTPTLQVIDCVGKV